MNTRAVLAELRELRKIAREFEQRCDRLIESVEQRGDDTADLIDQHMSDMGARRHCAATRRRISQGLPGAFISGRRHLLSREALAEELGLGARARLAKPSAGKASARQRMLDKLHGASPSGAEIGSAYDRAMARATKAGAPRAAQNEDDEITAMRARIARKTGRTL